MKILYVTSGTKAFGGISTYTDSVCKALKDEGYDVLLIRRGEYRNRMRFVLSVVMASIRYRPDIILSGHIRYAPLCFVLGSILGAPCAVFAYGIDAWNINRTTEKIALRLVSLIISISKYTKDRIVEQIPEVKNKILLLPPTVDEEVFYPHKNTKRILELYDLADKKIILTVTRIRANEGYKGYDMIIKSLPRLIDRNPDVRYLIAGDGDDRRRIESIAEAEGVKDYVVFAGEVSEEDIGDYYNLCDVFAMPSSREGFGIVFLEALACGKPVIAGDAGGSPEALLYGELGVLVDPADADAIYEALAKAIEGGEFNMAKDSEYLRERVISEYGTRKFKNKLARIIKKLELLG